jgi:hypothetical protein
MKPTEENPNRLVLTVPEFGARYDVKKRTVWVWLKRGLPHLKLSTRKTRIPVKEGDEWVKSNFLRQRLGPAKVIVK